jgi:hypothetical protein
MTDQREKNEKPSVHAVEIILPGQQDGAGRGGEAGAAGQSTFMHMQGQKPLSPFLRTAILVAVFGAGLALLALLVAFAATIALIAVPAALVAGLAAWIGMRWRDWRGG